MTQTVKRCRIEILVPEPMIRRVVGVAQSVGISGYTLLPTLGGAGPGGVWSDDQLSGAEARVLLVIITSREKAAALTDALAPMLDSHGLILTISAADVVRGQKF